MAERPDTSCDLTIPIPADEEETCLNDESCDDFVNVPSAPDSHREMRYVGDIQKKSSLMRAAGAVYKRAKKVGSGILSSGLQAAEFFLLKDQEEPDIAPGDIKYDFVQADFPETCKTISKRIASVSKKAFQVFPEFSSTLKRADKLLHTREITVNLFAQCNAGKSTLLNAVLGDTFLSTSDTTETCLRVLIKHDPNVHPPRRCKKCPACPCLEVFYYEKIEEIFGVKEIYERIRKENKKHRKNTYEHGRPDLLLRVNVPLLAEKVPEGWSVVLVDNPGFGEAKKHIAQVTNESWESSAGYVYITTAETKGLNKEEDLFKAFQNKGLLEGNQERVIIVLNKIDTRMSSKASKRASLLGQSSSIEDLLKDIQENVKDVTDVDFPMSSIIPISALWALISSKVSTLHETDDDYTEWMEWAKSEVPNTPSFTCGQGMKEADTDQMPGDEISLKLNEASGIESLKQKISLMVSSACIRIWGESLCGIYTSLLAPCRSYFDDQVQALCEEKEAIEPSVKRLGEKLQKIAENKLAIKTSFNLGHKSKIWLELESEYENDVEESGAVQKGIRLCHLEVENFKSACKEKISKNRYTPLQFKQDVESFLASMEDNLQSQFDVVCGFKKLNEIAHKHIERATARITVLHMLASEVSFQMASNVSSSISSEGMCTSSDHFLSSMDSDAQFQSEMVPKLGEIKSKIGIPDVELSFINRIFERIKKLVKRLSIGKHKPNEDDSKQEDCEDTTIRSDIPYKKWTADLEETMEELKSHLETACQDYFPSIKEKAIQYFYEQVYKRRVGAQFTSFKKDYKEKLKRAQKEHHKLKLKLEHLEATARHSEKMTNHFEHLTEHLKTVHNRFKETIPQSIPNK